MARADKPSEKTIKILDAWNISGLGIIAEVENIHNGLPKGTILKSQETNLIWMVESRIIETLAMDEITRFSNETEELIHLKFKNVAKMENAKDRMKERSSNQIFLYRLKPNEHNEKPKNGENLVIE